MKNFNIVMSVMMGFIDMLNIITVLLRISIGMVLLNNQLEVIFLL